MSSRQPQTAASEAAALCDDAQACKRMRQGATQHNRGGTKSEEKNTNQNASKRLLTASFVKAGDACMPASSQACKRMRQRATRHKRGGTKSEKKASKRLLTASFENAGDACMPASSQACKRMRQRATQHKRGETNSEEKTPFKTQSSGCLLQALSKPSRRTLACSCLLLPAGRREKCRVVGLIIRSGRSLRCHSDNAQACN